jgi:SPP1 family predicted phage head-tail adaptor
MDIGRFDKRITIQKRSATLDDYGQEINSWSDVATVWANVKPISGREKLKAGQVDSILTHTVAVRYNPAFMPPRTVDAWRIVYDGRYFNITASMDMDEASKYIIFDCTEGSIDGQ